MSELAFDDDRPNLQALKLKPEGEGHNTSLLTVAAKAYKLGASREDTLAHLQSAYASDRPDHNTAPERAVDRVWQAKGVLSKLVDPDKPKAPAFNITKLNIYDRTSMAEIESQSPHPVNIKPLEVIKTIFKKDDLVEIEGVKDISSRVVRVGKIKRIDDSWKFLNPSVFKSKDTPKGNHIPRTDSNVLKRCFMILECDYDKEDGEAVRERFNTFVMVCGKHLPLVMAIDTGGKSVHFWFSCPDGWTDEVDQVFSLACAHGADHRMRIKSQKARMPNVSGYDRRRNQKLIYFNPDALGGTWDVEGLKQKFKQTTAHSTTFNPNEVFYFTIKGSYFVDIGKFYRGYSRKLPVIKGIKRYYDERGLSDDESKAKIESDFESIEIDNAVDWCGKLAGYGRGISSHQGRKFLITDGFNIPHSVEGDSPLHDKVIREAFPDETSHIVFLAWLAAGVKAVRAGIHQSAPMLVLAGEANAGKSLLAHIVKMALGGRSANPMTAWSGKLPWNDNLLGAELLLIDDSVSSTDPRARKAFGAMFKEAVYAGDVTINTRQKSSFSCRPVWRVMICCNETPENLSVIPPLEEGIEDKIALLRVNKITPPMPAEAPAEKKAFAAALNDELPAFLHMLEKVELPPSLKDSRSGVTAWKDPQLLKDLMEISPEVSFENMLEIALTGNIFSEEPQETIWMSAVEVRNLLDSNSQTRQQASTLLKYDPNTGRYLSTLKKRGSRIVKESKVVNGQTRYLLKYPQGNDDDQTCF